MSKKFDYITKYVPGQYRFNHDGRMISAYDVIMNYSDDKDNIKEQWEDIEKEFPDEFKVVEYYMFEGDSEMTPALTLKQSIMMPVAVKGANAIRLTALGIQAQLMILGGTSPLDEIRSHYT